MQSLGEHVLFVHAHPDDEALSTGIAIARLADEGGMASVLTCTLGERGEVRPAVRDQLMTVGIQAYRKAELSRAVAALGADSYVLPGFSDSGMRWVSAGVAGPAADAPANALSTAGVMPIAQTIARVAYDLNATSIVTYDADGGYGHPDHVAVHEASRAAAAHLDVPLWVRLGDGVAPRDGDVEVHATPAALARVDEALRSHASQLELISGPTREVVHVGGERQLLPEVERYRLVTIKPPRRSRLHVALIAAGFAVAGTVLGLAGVFTHQSGWPATLLAVVAAVALIAGARWTADSRLFAAAAGFPISIVTSIITFGLFTDVAFGSPLAIVQDNALAWTWIIVPAAATLIAMAWPTRAGIERIRLAAREGAPS